jgi:uncharacterized protein
VRVFLDTNVLVSGLATRGLCTDVVRLAIEHHELVTAEVVLDELVRVLTRKLKMRQDTVDGYVALLREYDIEPRPESLPLIGVRDRADLPVLAAALSAGADVLVTGDKDLLVLAPEISTIRILDPRTFWTEFRPRPHILP